MKHSYELSLQAQDDLMDIFIFSIGEFGVDQAEKYRDGLLKLLDQLVEFPFEGISRPEINKDVRSMVYVSHTIYYSIGTSKLFIERILHQSRDTPAHF
ncbi:type II toxin-antitoxin system RelE/ParE family toxin [Dokdonia sinensis]|uniref:Toxin n=1 Tax=Dokdonia sinensis TaxID=2479847 RepID=A0A3M0FV86_9FLAO|nr:type II toxin-antitoxin system RelE/ParE family toxin [Dokdonia sinensis]RMB56415.1 type II toxin-antitoxin system RelE/ParE family toxin [Dokdonia sinensis]